MQNVQEVAKSITDFIEDNLTEDNYDIQEGGFIWAEMIAEHLAAQGYLKS